MDDISREIIKWVLIVFLTGFVAQFGKSLTEWILRKRGKKEAPDEKSSMRAKIDKKRQKAAVKAAKKR